ncbi:hypothetical protein LZ012_05020 [Dechloromonas sp. XY25]|uniref:Uncharacterized protein n=1 Tax=Dechloromonas hankyongensis TaxID=2908002 RepID=A0ABS9JZM7_9RHOO|nr:hypothetical protein [Dechloromonas hankyongensis]MCG2576352.1 hypothetical protein [Dechloromonas hankyongensis]
MTIKLREEDLLKAAGAVGALLPCAASVAVGISFLAYFAGWRDANAYFTALGAPWVVSLLPASRLLYLSGEFVAGILVCAFLAMNSVVSGEIGLKGLRRWSWIAFALAMLSGINAHLLPPTLVSPKVAWGLSNFAGLCIAVASGATLGEVVIRLKDNELRWTASHAYSIYLAVFIGLYWMPSQIGTARAKYHLASLEATLPAVRLTTPATNENWRLVEAIGESVLIMDR